VSFKILTFAVTLQALSRLFHTNVLMYRTLKVRSFRRLFKSSILTSVVGIAICYGMEIQRSNSVGR